MAFFMGSEGWRSMQWIIPLAGLCLLFFPMVCTASTPPVQPSLLFEITNASMSQNASLMFSAAWNGYVSYNKPPEQIIVYVFFEPDGSRLGTFPIPRLNDKCTSENTCMYRTSVTVEDFPSGSFMLIATDPLSGVSNRQMISIPPHSTTNIGFFKQGEHDQTFLLTSAILGAFLVVVLAILVREKI
ncbi:MAG: hypothetical protein M0Q92_14560 [Methanoregula sp.]|nr:hypothetical protein [Methanoregula sp.]